jgi:hypothetical protein
MGAKMRRTDRATFSYLALLFLAAALLASTTASTASRSGTQLARTTDSADLADLLGTWSGTWNDTIYSVGGSLSFAVSENSGVYTGTGQIGLQSLGLGVESGSAAGNVVGDALVFSFISNTVGSGAGSVDANTGAAAGAGSVAPPLNYGAFIFQGAVTGDAMSGMFDFTSPTGGAGVASLTRTGTAVENADWSNVKGLYRDDVVHEK